MSLDPITQGSGSPDAAAAAARASGDVDRLLADVAGASFDLALPGSVHLHCTDAAGEWTIRPGTDGWMVAREHAKGDCALRGPAAALLAVLRHEAPASSVDVLGDASVASAFLALLPKVGPAA